MPPISDGSSHSHFHLLVLLMLLFWTFGAAWMLLYDQGIVKTAEIAAEAFEMTKMLFAVALGVFRGMSPDK
jgi:hypothetical protein